MLLNCSDFALAVDAQLFTCATDKLKHTPNPNMCNVSLVSLLLVSYFDQVFIYKFQPTVCIFKFKFTFVKISINLHANIQKNCHKKLGQAKETKSDLKYV